MEGARLALGARNLHGTAPSCEGFVEVALGEGRRCSPPFPAVSSSSVAAPTLSLAVLSSPALFPNKERRTSLGGGDWAKPAALKASLASNVAE